MASTSENGRRMVGHHTRWWSRTGRRGGLPKEEMVWLSPVTEMMKRLLRWSYRISFFLRSRTMREESWGFIGRELEIRVKREWNLRLRVGSADDRKGKRAWWRQKVGVWEERAWKEWEMLRLESWEDYDLSIYTSKDGLPKPTFTQADFFWVKQYDQIATQTPFNPKSICENQVQIPGSGEFCWV